LTHRSKGLTAGSVDYNELDDLISALQAAVDETHPQRGYWGELWNLAREVGAGFKGTRYPTRADRENAWKKFQDLVAHAKARSEENRARIAEADRQWEARQEESQWARESIRAKTAAARPLTGLERDIADIVLLPARLIAAILLKLVGIEIPSQLEEIRQELLACNEALREAWAEFNRRKADMLPGDKNQAFEGLQAARSQLDEAWRRWKEAKASLHEQRQREWEQRQRIREARQAEQYEKHQQFVMRVERNIANLEAKLGKATDALERQEVHLADLREKYDTAWSEGFKERCSEWIDEAEERIQSIKEHIERLEGWIDEERGKLQ
jgi:hypothetical protein